MQETHYTQARKCVGQLELNRCHQKEEPVVENYLKTILQRAGLLKGVDLLGVPEMHLRVSIYKYSYMTLKNAYRTIKE